MRDTNGPLADTPVPRARPYYEDLGRACDHLLRCAECRRLVTHDEIVTNKGTTRCCGTRRVKEVRTLSLWEWLKVRLGIIDFEHRAEFLKEFARG